MLRSSLVHYWAIAERDDPPLWAVRVPHKRTMRCRALDDDVAIRLEEAALARGDLKGLAVIIGLYLGLRRFEIAKLRWADFEAGWVKIVGKGDLEAELPVHRVVLEYFGRVPHESPFIFPGRWLGPINPSTLWGWVHDVAADAGLDPISTHVLRHTALAMGNDATGDLRAVQDFARHARTETTAGYTRTTTRQLLKVSDAIADGYHPPIDMGPSETGQEPELPSLSFAELVATVEGAPHVRPWIDLARIMARRAGWRLAGSIDGSGFIRFEFSPFLSVDVSMAYSADSPPQFVVSRALEVAQNDLDDIDRDSWDYLSLSDLEADLPSFEQGASPRRADHEDRCIEEVLVDGVWVQVEVPQA